MISQNICFLLLFKLLLIVRVEGIINIFNEKFDKHAFHLCCGNVWRLAK